ncbi:unnamed protein product [Cercopithifilaria johnstoni]|uniref:Uncharacterized protein n=1 Tax=Cercopithifilaria johnstoni TaxID=2874296 RepID=A0A8J2MA43_9BILA|nr:unnamed protein product [Cercopithifilaria johnstoni]
MIIVVDGRVRERWEFTPDVTGPWGYILCCEMGRTNRCFGSLRKGRGDDQFGGDCSSESTKRREAVRHRNTREIRYVTKFGSRPDRTAGCVFHRFSLPWGIVDSKIYRSSSLVSEIIGGLAQKQHL